MLKIIRRNQKKLLAVFTALLMVVFIVDIGVNRTQGPKTNPGEKVVGTFGDSQLRAMDVQGAQAVVHQLATQIVLPDPQGAGGRQFRSIMEAVGLPPQVIIEWMNNPAAFALLLEESQRIPVYVQPQQVDALLAQAAVAMNDRVVAISNLDPRLANQVRGDIIALLQVIGGFNRMMEMFKTSQPTVERAVAEESQLLTVLAVPFDARDFLAAAPEPTPEQLQEFFKKYAELPPSAASEVNPLGFGYRFPPRIKLQYITIPRDQVLKVIRARKSDHAWEVDANRYYLQHEKEFPTTQPAPTTQGTTQPSTQPAYRPYSEVRAEILERLQTPEAQKLTDQIRRKIETTMSADYQAWAKLNPPTTGPATAPAQAVPSSLGVAYDKFEYLEALAKKIQEEFGVLPAVASIAEWKSMDDLADTPTTRAIAREAFALSAAFAPPSSDPRRRVLHVYQPSPPSTDADSNTSIYRLTEASTAHAPRDHTEVADNLLADWKMAWAWDQAKSEAAKLVEQARQSNLPDAASPKPVITVGPFSRFGMVPSPELGLDDPRARARFISEAGKLTSDITPQVQHPSRVVEVPPARRAFAVQLSAVDNDVTPDDMASRAIQWPYVARSEWAQMVAPQWFSYQGVATRLKYVDSETARRAADAAAP